MIDLKDCIKVSKMSENEDGSADVEFEYTQAFVDIYKAATGKKATKKNLKRYLNKILGESSKKWKEGKGIPCVIPIKKESKKSNFSPKEN
jgi:hypothetical protein